MDLFEFVGAQFSWFSAVSFTMHGWASLTNKKHGTSIHLTLKEIHGVYGHFNKTLDWVVVSNSNIT